MSAIAVRFEGRSEGRQKAVWFMIGMVLGGGTVVIGSDARLDPGQSAGSDEEGHALVVRCRSTRDAFLLHAPDIWNGHPPHARFYWEMEVREECRPR